MLDFDQILDHEGLGSSLKAKRKAPKPAPKALARPAPKPAPKAIARPAPKPAPKPAKSHKLRGIVKRNKAAQSARIAVQMAKAGISPKLAAAPKSAPKQAAPKPAPKPAPQPKSKPKRRGLLRRKAHKPSPKPAPKPMARPAPSAAVQSLFLRQPVPKPAPAPVAPPVAKPSLYAVPSSSPFSPEPDYEEPDPMDEETDESESYTDESETDTYTEETDTDTDESESYTDESETDESETDTEETDEAEDTDMELGALEMATSAALQTITPLLDKPHRHHHHHTAAKALQGVAPIADAFGTPSDVIIRKADAHLIADGYPPGTAALMFSALSNMADVLDETVRSLLATLPPEKAAVMRQLYNVAIALPKCHPTRTRASLAILKHRRAG